MPLTCLCSLHSWHSGSNSRLSSSVSDMTYVDWTAKHLVQLMRLFLCRNISASSNPCLHMLDKIWKKKKYIYIKSLENIYLFPHFNHINLALNCFSSTSRLVSYVKYVQNVWLITSPLVLVETVSWRTYRYYDETARYLCLRNLSVKQKNCDYLQLMPTFILNNFFTCSSEINYFTTS
jgi:hypothetical protein